MPVTTKAVQTVPITGIAAAFTACNTDGEQFINDGKTFLEFKNTSGGALTVLINSQVPCEEGYDHDITITVPLTTGDMRVAPLPINRFNDANGYVQMTYPGGVTNLTIAAFNY